MEKFKYVSYELPRIYSTTRPSQANKSKFIDLVHLQCVTICLKNVERKEVLN